jgi:hypothetical protein
MVGPVATVAGVLADAGVHISEAQFAAVVAEVLTEVGPAAADDPRAALTGDEASALEGVGADLRPRGRREPDPRGLAAATYAGVLAASLSVGEVAGMLGVDTSRVRHRLARRQLVGVRRTDGWHLPSWQFGDDRRPLPGIERVLRALPAGAHPVVVTRFFLSPQPELVVDGSATSPREWLSGGGDPTPVAHLATAVGVAP